MAKRGPAPFISAENKEVIINWIQQRDRYTVRELRKFCDEQGIKWNHTWLSRLSKEAGYHYYEGWLHK